MACEDDGSYFNYLDSELKVPEDMEHITGLIKMAYKISKKLENVGERRAETKERRGLENRIRLRKTQSLEVLVDRVDAATVETHS